MNVDFLCWEAAILTTLLIDGKATTSLGTELIRIATPGAHTISYKIQGHPAKQAPLSMIRSILNTIYFEE